MTPQILEAQAAIRLINEALESLDLDSLAQEVSRIAVNGPVVVIHDCSGVEEDADLEEAFKSNKIAESSDVYEDGNMVGRVEETGKITRVCNNCGTGLAENGFCMDETCPYSSRPQEEVRRE